MRTSISVCVPTYNGERYLQQCLDSITSQTYADLEIILVDDSSNDGTWRLAQQRAALDPRIKLFRNAFNLGLVGNWNRCVELAKGEWIKFVFQDDFLHPECIERMANAGAHGASLVICPRKMIFEEGMSDSVRKNYLWHETAVRALFHANSELPPRFFIKSSIERFGLNLVGEPTSVMLKRNLFEMFGYFNPAFVALCDWEYWLRVGMHVGATGVRDELAYFRVHSSSVSAENLGRAEFRATHLDMLVLLHQMIDSPYYGPIRKYAAEINLDLRKTMKEKQNEARAIAAWASQPPTLDRSLLEDWQTLTSQYPALWIGDVPHYVWRARTRLARFLPRKTRDRLRSNVDPTTDPASLHSNGGIE